MDVVELVKRSDRVKVRFTASSGANTRTLHLVYQRCSTAAVAPRFTG